MKSGAPGWNRTTDLGLRSPLLYPTELPEHELPWKCAKTVAKIDDLEKQYLANA